MSLSLSPPSHPPISNFLKLNHATASLRLQLNTYRDWKETGFTKQLLYMNLETKRLREDQEIDGKMKWGVVED